MSLRLDWFLPTTGDSRSLVGGGHSVPRGIGQSGQGLGSASLIWETDQLEFLVAFCPGSIQPTLAAQMASTYQRISKVRLLLNIVSGGEPSEQRRFGDPASYGSVEHYARTDEFLTVPLG